MSGSIVRTPVMMAGFIDKVTFDSVVVTYNGEVVTNG